MRKISILILIGFSSCNSANVCYFRTTEAATIIKTETTDFVPSEGIVTKTKSDSVTKTILLYPLSCDYRVNDVVVIEGNKRILLEKL